MATFKVHESLTWACEAGADLTTSLNKLVKLQGDLTLVLAGDSDKALGSIIEVPLAATAPYGPASVQFGGIAKLSASAAIPAGTRVQAAASGQIKAGTVNPVGVTLEASTGANQLVAVALIG